MDAYTQSLVPLAVVMHHTVPRQLAVEHNEAGWRFHSVAVAQRRRDSHVTYGCARRAPLEEGSQLRCAGVVGRVPCERVAVSALRGQWWTAAGGGEEEGPVAVLELGVSVVAGRTGVPPL